MGLFNFTKKGTAEPNVRYDGSEGFFTDERDGLKYKWIRISDKIWMADNLAYIPFVCSEKKNKGIWVSGYEGDKVKEAIKSFEYRTFGCLYNLKTAIKSVPRGWRLPTFDEWMTLINKLGGIKHAGGKLKDINYWEYPNTGAVNSVGFSALPGGFRTWADGGGFRSSKSACVYWSAPEKETSQVVKLELRSESEGVFTDSFSDDYLKGNYGYSVRCIKD